MPSPGSSSSEHFYRELSVDRGRPGGGPSVASRPVAPGSANGSEDTRDKDGKLARAHRPARLAWRGGLTHVPRLLPFASRRKKCDQVRPVCGSWCVSVLPLKALPGCR